MSVRNLLKNPAKINISLWLFFNKIVKSLIFLREMILDAFKYYFILLKIKMRELKYDRCTRKSSHFQLHSEQNQLAVQNR